MPSTFRASIGRTCGRDLGGFLHQRILSDIVHTHAARERTNRVGSKCARYMTATQVFRHRDKRPILKNPDEHLNEARES